jgi:hypothetical protein
MPRERDQGSDGQRYGTPKHDRIIYHHNCHRDSGPTEAASAHIIVTAT